ncbi:hypothetical protein MIR68_007297 [Amoeboaphelidium protococcarum]|nr:hypothetical protein MIR68_007297 [Amoeboaphelidium protococcarum]KAI3643919.1 hypothetical protein MP228_010083 [Amoeboaphelidium protococcarum]
MDSEPYYMDLQSDAYLVQMMDDSVQNLSSFADDNQEYEQSNQPTAPKSDVVQHQSTVQSNDTYSNESEKIKSSTVVEQKKDDQMKSSRTVDIKQATDDVSDAEVVTLSSPLQDTLRELQSARQRQKMLQSETTKESGKINRVGINSQTDPIKQQPPLLKSDYKLDSPVNQRQGVEQGYKEEHQPKPQKSTAKDDETGIKKLFRKLTIAVRGGKQRHGASDEPTSGNLQRQGSVFGRVDAIIRRSRNQSAKKQSGLKSGLAIEEDPQERIKKLEHMISDANQGSQRLI